MSQIRRKEQISEYAFQEEAPILRKSLIRSLRFRTPEFREHTPSMLASEFLPGAMRSLSRCRESFAPSWPFSMEAITSWQGRRFRETYPPVLSATCEARERTCGKDSQ